MDSPPRRPDSSTERVGNTEWNRFTDPDCAACELTAEVLAGLFDPTTGRLRESPGRHSEIDNPSDDYFAWIVRELDLLGCEIRMTRTGRKLFVPAGVKVGPALITSVKTHGDRLAAYLVRLGRLPDPTVEPLPEAGRVVEWVGMDDANEHGVCIGEDLPARPWVRWKYRKTRVWHARSGDTWEE